MGGVTVGDGERTKEEKGGNRYPPHVKSPLTFGVHPKRTQTETATIQNGHTHSHKPKGPQSDHKAIPKPHSPSK